MLIITNDLEYKYMYVASALLLALDRYSIRSAMPIVQLTWCLFAALFASHLEHLTFLAVDRSVSVRRLYRKLRCL